MNERERVGVRPATTGQAVNGSVFTNLEGAA